MRNRKASSLVEFTLVGIPLIFVLLSTFEMARGMWIYNTLAYAVREGTRYAVVHGVNCSISPNSCSVTLGQVATVIRNRGVGLIPSQTNMAFTPSSGASITCTLDNCVNDSTPWPPANANNPGVDVQISATYPFRSALAMFWPGSGTVTFGTYNLPASSRERIQF